jgi:hypothetical protein
MRERLSPDRADHAITTCDLSGIAMDALANSLGVMHSPTLLGRGIGATGMANSGGCQVRLER